MIRPTFVCGLVAIAAVVAASGEDFPLTFRTIPAKDFMAFPGGYGVSGALHLDKPIKLKNEPKAVSRHPLYADFRYTPPANRFIFRLDESKGDGTGYDQLIGDMNQNGDLTDDAVIPLVVLPTEGKSPSRASRPALFGPIQAAAGKMIAGGRPIYLVPAYINDDLSSILRSGQSVQYDRYLGALVLKAGWYVDTTVTLDGVKQKIGVFDGNNNLRLGNISKPRTYFYPGQVENWQFEQADDLLVDADGSGAFERDAFDTESCAYGSVLYFGATPYKIALAPDYTSLRVEPWTAALAEVALQPHGEQVSSVTLAWERPNQQWQLIRAGVADGKIRVPPGNYRLYRCVLVGKDASRDQVTVAANQSVTKTPLSFAAGKPNTLRCGGPLEIQIKARMRKPDSGDLRTPPLASDSEFILTINATVRGVDGEIYSVFAKGEKFKDAAPQPTLTVVDSEGKKVADGKLEFG